MSRQETTAARGTRALADELNVLAEIDPAGLAERIARLSIRELAELALRLPAEERLRFLTTAPRASRLVHSIPDQDLYLTVRDVGPVDAAPLLALASPGQIGHLVDLEAWRGSRFDAERAGAWVTLLLEAGDDTVRRFLRQADDELLALLLKNWARLEKLEFEDEMAEKHGHGQSEAGDERGHVTPDGNFRFRPERSEQAPAIARILRLLFVEQPERYNELLDASLWLLPSEVEERALQWRQSRLEEHGFPTMEEAHEIYRAPTGVPVSHVALETEGERLLFPRSALRLPPEQSPLGPALDRLPPEEHERVLAELTAVANRVLIADGRDTGDRDSHRYSLEKVAGCLQIAFEATAAADPASAARLLLDHPVLELFRRGNETIVEVRGRAVRLFREGWPHGEIRTLELLDAPARQRLAGLLSTPPMFHAVYEIDQNEELRAFRGAEDLREAEVAVELAEVLGDLFVGQLGLDVDATLAAGAGRAEPVRFSMLWLTLLAHHHLDGTLSGAPLTPAEAGRFLDEVALRSSAPAGAAEAATDGLVRFVVARGLPGRRPGTVLESFGRFALTILDEQAGRLSPGTVPEARYLPCLWIDPGRDGGMK